MVQGQNVTKGLLEVAMGQNPVPPVNIPIPTKIGPKMGGAPTPKWEPIGFDPQPSETSSGSNPSDQADWPNKSKPLGCH